MNKFKICLNFSCDMSKMHYFCKKFLKTDLESLRASPAHLTFVDGDLKLWGNLAKLWFFKLTMTKNRTLKITYDIFIITSRKTVTKYFRFTSLVLPHSLQQKFWVTSVVLFDYKMLYRNIINIEQRVIISRKNSLVFQQATTTATWTVSTLCQI